MPNGSFVGQAWVQISPSFQGFQTQIGRELGAAMPKAGAEAGKTMGAGMAAEGEQTGRSMAGSIGRGLASISTAPLQAVGSALLDVSRQALNVGGVASIAFAGFTVEAGRTAMRFGEMDAALGAIAKQTGVSKDVMDEQIKTIRETGVTAGVAQKLVGQFARADLDVAKATDLARTAQDLAILTQQNSSETLDELLYGIQTGNTSLNVWRQLNVNAGQAMKEFAGGLGKNAKDLTAAEKQQALMNAALEAGEKIQGTYAAAMEEPGKVLRSFPRLFDDAKLALGQGFLPAIGDVIVPLYHFTKELTKGMAEGGKFAPVVEAISDIIKGLLEPVGQIAESMVEWIKGLSASSVGGFADALKGLAPILPAVASALAAFAGGNLLKNIPIVGDQLGGLVEKIGPVKAGLLGLVIGMPEVRDAFGEILKAIMPLVKVIGGELGTLLEQLAGWLANTLSEAMQALLPALRGLMPALAGLVQVLGKALLDALETVAPFLPVLGEALGRILAGVTPLLPQIGELVGQLVDLAIKAVLPLIDPLIRIAEIFFQVLTQAVGALLPVLSALLPPLTGLAVMVANFLGQALEMLAPLLKEIGQLFVVLAKAIFPVLPPLMDMAQIILKSLLGALKPLMGVLVEVARALIGSLAKLLPTLTPVLLLLARAFQQILRAVAPLLPLLMRVVVKVIKALMPILPVVVSAFAKLVGAFTKLLGPVLDLLPPILGLVEQVLPPLIDLFEDLVPLLIDALMPILPALVDVFMQLFKAVAPLIPPILNLVKQILPLLVDVFMRVVGAVAPLIPLVLDLVKKLLPVLVKIVETLVPPLTEVATQIIQAIVPILPTLAGLVMKVVEAFLPLLPVVVKLVETLLPPLADLFLVLVDALLPLLPPIMQLVKAFLPPLIGLFKALMPVIQLVVGLLPPIVSFFSTIISWIGKLFTWIMGGSPGLIPALNTLKDVFKKVWDAIRAAVDFVWKNVLRPVFRGIRELWDTVAGAFKAAWDNVIRPAWDTLKSAFQSGWNFVRDNIFRPLRDVWDRVCGAFKTAWETIIRPAWNTLKEALRSGWEFIRDKIFAPLRQAWETLAEGFKKVKENTIDKVWEGIKAGIRGVRDTFNEIVEKIRTIWDRIQKVFATPVKVVLQKIVLPLMQGANFILSKIGLGLDSAIASLKGIVQALPSFHRGGPVPGHAPGRGDNLLAWVRSGEWVLTERQRRAIGDDTLRRLPRYAEGGPVGPARPGPRGFWEDVGSVFGSGAGAVGDFAGDVVSGVTGFLRDKAVDAFEKLLKPLRKLLDKIPGDTPVAGWMGKFGGYVIDELVGFLRGKAKPEPAGPVAIGDIVKRVLAQFPGLVITSALRPGDPGYHGRNLARDLGGEQGLMDRAGTWIKDTLQTVLAEGIHNPTLSVKNGKLVPASFWGAGTWAGHINHIHLAADPARGTTTVAPGVAPGPGGPVERWRPVVVQAFGLWGLPADVGWVNGILQLIKHESGGNPNAINNWDINAQRGTPSQGLMQCVSLRTRILTRRGWLTYDQVHPGDETLGYNPATGRSEWTVITKVVRYEDAEVWRIGHKSFHAEVTPNHRWWSDTVRWHRPETLTVCPECGYRSSPRGVSTHRGRVHGIHHASRPLAPAGEFVRTDQFTSAHRLRLAAAADTDGIAGLSLEEAAIAGWLHGDGHLHPAETGGWDGTIYQSKPGQIARLRALLARVPHTETVRHRHPGHLPAHTFHLRRAWVTDLIKRAPDIVEDPEAFVLALSPAQRAAWLGAMIDAEGHRQKDPAGRADFVRISQTEGPLQNAIRLAVYLEGWRPTYSPNTAERRGYKPSGNVGLTKPHVAPVSFHPPELLDRQPAWCVKTDLETWTAGLDGQIFLTGNTIPSTFMAYRHPSTSTVITDPLANIAAGINYIWKRYGGIYNLAGYKSIMAGGGWIGYDRGGWLEPGASLVVNQTGRPEPVLTGRQWDELTAALGRGDSPAEVVGLLKRIAEAVEAGRSLVIDGREVARVVDRQLSWVGP